MFSLRRNQGLLPALLSIVPVLWPFFAVALIVQAGLLRDLRLLALLLHYLMLSFQSFLLIRPSQDRLAGLSLLARSKLHGSLAALSILPIFALALMPGDGLGGQLLSLFANMPSALEVYALGLLILWLSLILTAKLSHYFSLGFAMRQVGLGDFGRRTPFLPDTLLLLCEQGYLAFLGTLCLSSYFSRANLLSLPTGNTVLLIFSISGSFVLGLYRQVLQALQALNMSKISKYGPRNTKKLGPVLAEVSSVRVLQDDPPLSLISIKAPLQFPSPAEQHLHQAMSFAMLRFLKGPRTWSLARKGSHFLDHPLSIYLWNNSGLAAGSELEGDSHSRLDFVIEHQGGLEAFTPRDFYRGQPVLLWGPYFDLPPREITQLQETQKPIFLFAEDGGIIPMIALLRYLSARSQEKKLFLFHWQSQKSSISLYWQEQIEVLVQEMRGKQLKYTLCYLNRALQRPQSEALSKKAKLMQRYREHLAAEELYRSIETYASKYNLCRLSAGKDFVYHTRGSFAFQQVVDEIALTNH